MVLSLILERGEGDRCGGNEWGKGVIDLLTPDLLSNSPHCQPYNSYDVSLENLVLDQLIIP